jgi:hypothetical protein
MAKNIEWMTNVLATGGKCSDSDVGFEGESDFGGLFGRKWKPGRILKKFGRVLKEAGGKVAHGKIGSAFHTLARATKHSNEDIASGLAKVPALGPALHAVYTINTAPFEVATKIASGDRVDKAISRTFKDQVKAYQDIAPYVQMVISNVPGIGTGISGAIGAAVALSKGRPITEAVLEAAKGAMPGGPLAQAAFSTAVAGIQGKPIDQIVLAALPIDDTQKKLLATAVNSAKALAEGKRVDEVAMHAAMDQLPPDIHKAVQVGVALAQGQKLQKIAKDGLADAVPQLVSLGAKQASENPVFKAGLETVKHDPNMAKGYHLGLGFLQHKVNPTALIHVRANLSPAALKGFDIAASAKVGQVAKPLPVSIPPAQRFGYYLLQGMHGNKPKNNEAMMRVAAKHPEVKAGAIAASKEVQALNGPKLAWFHKVLRALHLEHTPPQLMTH